MVAFVVESWTNREHSEYCGSITEVFALLNQSDPAGLIIDTMRSARVRHTQASGATILGEAPTS